MFTTATVRRWQGVTDFAAVIRTPDGTIGYAISDEDAEEAGLQVDDAILVEYDPDDQFAYPVAMERVTDAMSIWKDFREGEL